MVGLILASRGRITNPFGAVNPAGSGVRIHQGVDTGHGAGTDIFAPAAGNAIAYDAGTRLGTYGKYWRIRHDDGTESLVAHLARHVGGSRRVSQGEVIGVMGNTGTIAVHCHQEYIVNGIRVDPTKYLASTAGGGTTPLPDPAIPNDEDDMPTSKQNSGFTYTRAADKAHVVLICNTNSGFKWETSNGPGQPPIAVSEMQELALAFDTNAFASITEGQAATLKAECERVISS